ncbi:putative cation diffusion facilitator 1 [Phaeomoniella chlamydospora]|uniref:Putative cation diffusion facilitator 1 n=1 Tax=Phaeomoniella chlamydospora TaxID=158046 RepID=A0A0G2E2Y4_PHACM|nr:putative cation diffusion facilitator 1 [Phaeomoniella chlamydospora]
MGPETIPMSSDVQHVHPSHIHDTATIIAETQLLRAHAHSSAVETEQNNVLRRHHTSATDASAAESQLPPVYTLENDPYALSSKLKTESEIDAIKANTGKKRDRLNCTPITIPTKASKLRGFYEEQNEQIHRLLKPVDEHRRQARETNQANHLTFSIAVYGSFIANVFLAILQLYGAISSGSLSLFTTMADALFDPASNLTLLLSNKAVKKVDARKFPAGKARIETAGNIVFCFIMTSVSLILIAFSVRELVEGHGEETKKFHLPSVIAVSCAFATKLGLFLYCWALRNVYSQIRILWEDHRNDLLINGFGILTSVGGSKLRWWIDPMGAILLSVLISCLWLKTAYTEFQLLIGKTADTEMLQLITYISMTHSPAIKALDTVRSWHSGPRLTVEVDVVMDPDETLRATHDVAEELQIKLENLPDVERAYVHVDYETTHKPEHYLKKEL